MTPRVKIGLLIAAHVGAGPLFAGFTAYGGGGAGQRIFGYGFIGCLYSELQLLGLWLGMSRSSWLTKGVALLLGVAWTMFDQFLINRGTVPRWQDAFGYAIVVIGFACIFALCRRFVARLEWRRRWQAKSTFQFTIRFLLFATATIAVVLSGGNVARDLHDGITAPIRIGIVATGILLSAVIGVWASLGRGPLRQQILFMLVANIAIGVVFHYAMSFPFSSLPEAIGIFIAPSIITLASLLVIRSCGYRLVGVHSGHTTEQGMLDGANRDGHSGTTIATP